MEARQSDPICLFDLTAEEIYATYVRDWGADEILDMDRTEIIRQLMVEEGLAEDAAGFAADQILRYAEQMTSGQ